nr:HD domain-containing protein [Lachnospiraceae bacterium]
MLNAIQKRHNLFALIMCVAGITLNLLLSSAVSALDLPLYLDTAGTIAIGMMGGSLPGVVVGFFTNIIKTISDPTAMYYGVLNVFIALVGAMFAKRGWSRKIGGIIGMIAVFSVIGGGLGSLIPYFTDGLSLDGESLSGIIYGTGLFGAGISNLLSSLIMDIPDKAITVLLAVLLVRIIPAGYHQLFEFDMWMQNPNIEKNVSSRDKEDVRVASLRIKVLIVLVFSLTTVAVVCIAISARVFQKMSVREHSELALGTATLTTSIINGGRIDEYLRDGGSSTDYRETKQWMERILASSSEIAYLYVYKAEPEGFRVVFDIATEDQPAGEIGSLIPYDGGFAPYISSLLAGKEVKPIITNDEYGHLLTAAKPVYDSEGRCTCYAIADVDMDKLNADKRSFLTEIISVSLGFFVLLCTFTIWLSDYNVVFPINSIARSIDHLAKADNTQESMDEDVRMFRNLGVRTGDELENLYLSACRMTRNQAEQLRSIRRLSDSTSKMQDGLIITMADLVESRDSDTGAHVQKTAAYVKIIVEGLNRKGYYAEKITSKFISDVVRSAPLHDIGKINIPDEVLNKPGKLTDEEFEIMKTHTVAGKRIIENAISTVKGDNYLKEARNMAAYHHERWDGKGYPEGIHGEVIPLSARIMAVADVFDALTSPRVYKPAFPLEKALAILEEGRGTQFDPKCIEVFMEALPEVKVILRKYNHDA